MESLKSHLVQGATSNVEIIPGEPGPAGAPLSYEARFAGGESQTITFQSAESTEGFTNEALLAIVEHRLQSFQKGSRPSQENEYALRGIGMALRSLMRRTAARMSRGVERRPVA